MHPNEYQRRSFSQFGEDGVLTWLFHGVHHGFYVDVGCHHPYRFSNTAVLHEDFSWSGINIDIDPRAIEAFSAARSSDKNILMGVAKTSGVLEAVIFEEGALNSLDISMDDNPAWKTIPRERRTVQVAPLAQILAENMQSGQHIDLLNIDAEGLDLVVLQSLDWAVCRPAVIAVEAQELKLESPADDPTFCFLRAKNYVLISHVAITSIYRSLM